MPRFAANLSFLFQDVPFLERFAAAAACGFAGVECLFPYDWPAEEIARALADAGLEMVLFNLPPGDWAGGERGLAGLPGREADFRGSLDLALHYAGALDCRRLHALAGAAPAAAPWTPEEWEPVYLANLRHAADRLAVHGRTVLVEAINGRDMPGYLLDGTRRARRLLEAAGRPNLKLQLDFYHAQILEGGLTRTLEELLGWVGHVQIAGVPGRHEPDLGEVNYPHLMARLDELGYAGWVGCEYRPRGATRDGLGWGRRWGLHP